MSEAPADRDLVALTQAYLARHQVMTLATTGPAGLWAAAVFYCEQGFDLFFLSAGHTRHGQNLLASGRAAATIQHDNQTWATIQGIQLEGAVMRLSGARREAAVAAYGRRYPFVADPAPPIAAALARVEWFRLRPDRLFFIDNRLGLGHRDEVPLP